MTPEEKALARFVQEKERGRKKTSMFDLEEDDGEDEALTHLGQSLFSGAEAQDDFDAGSLENSDEDAEAESAARARKRRRLEEAAGDMEDDNRDQIEASSDKPKTKQEVMNEVMAKSKLHKYERQQAREDDDELRAELDEGLHDIYAFLRRGPKRDTPSKVEDSSEPHINPDRAALLNGKSRADADREYDARMRQMVFDARSKPTNKTKTEEEKAVEEAARLREREVQRLRRMAGDDDDEPNQEHGDHEEFDELNEPHILGEGIPVEQRENLGVEDEDDFILDDDLIAGASSDSESEADDDSSQTSESPAQDEDEDDLEFLADVLPEEAHNNVKSLLSHGTVDVNGASKESSILAFAYPCPQSHKEFTSITAGTSPDELPIIIQRIRLLHNPKLAASNKPKLAAFARVLVEHIPHAVQQTPRPSFAVLEALIRHIHSLSKNFPAEVAASYREHLSAMHNERPLALHTGDLIVLTGIGSTFSTSDHFHQVATPAMMTMARYLGQRIPRSLSDLAKGLYLCSLCLQYQRLARRYVPEVVNFVLNTLQMLAPVKPSKQFGPYPSHDSPASLRLTRGRARTPDSPLTPNFWLVEASAGDDADKLTLLATCMRLAEQCSTLWEGKDAYVEMMLPLVAGVGHLCREPEPSSLPSSLGVSPSPPSRGELH